MAEVLNSHGDRRMKALEAVDKERIRQNAEWGPQNHKLSKWVPILGEEFGELCEAMNETIFEHPKHPERGGYENMYREASHLAAVAVSFMEYLERQSKRK